MWIVRPALSRPYTFLVMAVALLIMGPLTILRSRPTFSRHQHPGRKLYRAAWMERSAIRTGASAHCEQHGRVEDARSRV
jgi:hypothetical protein